MRVVQYGPGQPVWGGCQITCPRCKSLLEVQESDLKPVVQTYSYDSYGDSQRAAVAAQCPVCSCLPYVRVPDAVVSRVWAERSPARS